MQSLFFRFTISLCVICLGLSATCDAQYLERRKKFGQMEYTYQAGDPYHRFAAALGAAILPGTGHLIAGEPKRALGFAAGFWGSATLSYIGLVNILDENFNPQDPGRANFKQYKKLFAVGMASTMVFYFYGIFDAMEVAEINNLAYRYRQNGLYLQLSPDFNSLTAQPQLDLRLKYTFGN